MSAADALKANRACAAPWIKDAVDRPKTKAPPVLREHRWQEADDGAHECATCGAHLSKHFVVDMDVAQVSTDTALDIAIYFWVLEHPRSEVARLVTACKEVR